MVYKRKYFSVCMVQVSLWSTLQEKTFLWKELLTRLNNKLDGVLHMANIDEGTMYAFTFRRKASASASV